MARSGHSVTAWRALSSAPGGLSLSDPAVLERFRDAAVDLLTRPVFNAPPDDGNGP